MSNFTSEVERKILDHVHGVADFDVTLPLQLALIDIEPTDEDPGTEVNGGTYARQDIVLTAADEDSLATNDADISFPTGLPAGDVDGFAIYDSAAVPLRIWQGPNTSPVTLEDGDGFEVLAGALEVGFD